MNNTLNYFSRKVARAAGASDKLTELREEFSTDKVMQMADLPEYDFNHYNQRPISGSIVIPDDWHGLQIEFNEARCKMADSVILIFDNKFIEGSASEAANSYELSRSDSASERLELCYHLMGYSKDDAEFMVLNEKASLLHALCEYYSEGLNIGRAVRDNPLPVPSEVAR